MVMELQNAGVDPTPLKRTSPEILSNIKFEFKDFILTKSEDLEEISEDDSNITTNRYKLLPKKSDLILNSETEDHEGNLKNPKKRKRTLGGETTVDPIHDKIQNALCMLLRTEHSKQYKKVDIETKRVDIKALTHDNQWHFYEIKTDSVKLSIRKGIGQLLEYAFYPQRQIAQKLIIISDTLPNNDTQKYLKHIRNKFYIPVFYRQFDLEKNELSKEY